MSELTEGLALSDRLRAEARGHAAGVAEERQRWEKLLEPLRLTCVEDLGREENWHRCDAPAEFLLWGKLIPPEGLGPRCYDHAAKHVGFHALSPHSGYALVDLRPFRVKP